MDTNYICMNCMSEKQSGQAVCPSCSVDDRYLPAEPHALPLRTLLHNKYLIGRILGSGGFGNTYLALDLMLRQKIAIKEYLPRDFATRALQQTNIMVYSGERSEHFQHGMDKFLDEARTLAKFNNHPGIVSILDFFHANNTAYIVMEYVEGVTLKQYLAQKGGHIPLQDALQIMAPVMDALREVHSVSMLHRDVSPDNIYITRDKRVKLLDFGAARQSLGDVSKSLSVILKPGYAPSEQYSSRGKQGPWTDVYAVSATLYAAVSGVVPADAMARMEEEVVEPLGRVVAGVPANVEQAVMKGLAIRGAERWQSMTEFQQALVDVLDTKPKMQVTDYVEIQKSITNPQKWTDFNVFEWTLIMIAVGIIMFFIVISFISISVNQTVTTVFPVGLEQTTSEVRNRNIPNLKIGDYIRFGKYYNQPIIWRVIHKDEDDNPMLFSDKIISIKAFDAAGKYHPEGTRRDFGSNNYENANLTQWLNSDERSISWKQNRPNADNMWDGENFYDMEKGFLADGNFTKKERGYIKPRIHKVLLATIDENQADGGNVGHIYNESIVNVVKNYDSAWYKNMNDKVFLLSVKDLKEYMYDNRTILGENWWIGEPTAEAVKNSKYIDERLKVGEKWHYWLNTPLVGNDNDVRVVSLSGNIPRDAYAGDDGIGVRPALQLNLQSAIFTSDGAGTAKKPYTVKSE